MPKLLITMCACLLLASSALAFKPLLGTVWVLEDMAGRGADFEEAPQLILHPDGRLNGSGGCNVFFGSYTLKNDDIKIGPLGSTKRSCGEPADQMEARYFSILSQAESIRLSNDVLTIQGASGSLRFTPGE